MFLKKDERIQTANRIAIRYIYFFETLLILILWIATIISKNLTLFPPIHLFNSFYISFSINPDISILASTQFLVTIVAQAIINKRLGGTYTPIVSGSNGFRFMDERERIISDRAAFIAFLYTNIFLIILTITDIFTSGKLGLPLIIISLQFIIYIIIKKMLLHNYGENIS
ncbi:hypothetical protein [Clostridium tagluense]|uniref:hypothetical protein n=1 Tax=Clostridium tagluense TaxID=360422 RepID=UPI001C6E2590|nr:hypothetical protein [Clostridium tagluense]MBW9158942.1 hypothetical protein [Clostridium tagluense]WLC68327.1 hypothetical protein KTC93_24590 [Clostridium tagluense]